MNPTLILQGGISFLSELSGCRIRWKKTGKICIVRAEQLISVTEAGVPGITAFVRFQESSPPLSQLLSRVLQASYPLPDLKTARSHIDSVEVALGGTFPPHFHRVSVTATRDTKTLLFYGELYNSLDGKSEAEYALRTIVERGFDSLVDLNGPFVFFVWDERTQELTVATDRLGRFPVFYCAFNRAVAVTTDLHSLFKAGVIVPELDEESIVDFLGIGFPLGEQSLFRGVKRLTGGGVWTFARNGMKRYTYWQSRFTNTLDDPNDMIDAFQHCTARAVRRWNTIALTLSGGWDSRATCALTSTLNRSLVAATFGVKGSTDVDLAASVAKTVEVPHTIVEPEDDFFHSFPEWAEKVIILSNGHAPIDLAFQIYVYNRLREQFPAVLDSAGCEFRRGIRARRTAQGAKRTGDVAKFLTSMYATGIWNAGIIANDFYHAHSSTTAEKLTSWLDSLSASFEDQIDAFSSQELWAHHYAHGYPLQTSLIACHMPFSDNEFYDLFLQASRRIRWSHEFHRAVIRRFAPMLEHIPISHGHCKVPYGESILRYAPVLYHRMVSRVASVEGLSWLRSFDNYKPFRPYHRWYCRELEEYVRSTLGATTLASSGYLNGRGIDELLEAQRKELHDYSHGISILLSLAHLLSYVDSFKRYSNKG